MTAIKLSAFGGEIPAWDSRLLPEGQSTYALNCYLLGGNLIGWRQPELLHTLNNSAAKFVYRIVNDNTNNTKITADDSFWLELEHPDSTVMRSPVVLDSFDRHYWVMPGEPPKYSTYDRIINGDHPWLLGIPGSGCAPGVTIDGGGDTSQMGYPTVMPDAGATDFRAGNSIFLIPFVPDGSMLVQSVSFMPASTDEALRFQAVVYSDLNGSPYVLIGTGEEVIGVTTGAEASSVITNGVSVISNTTYWLGIAIDSSVDVIVASIDANKGADISNTYSNGPPETATATIDQPTWQLWGNLLGASVFTARAYVYTWISEYGEEGPPSPPTVVNGWSNGTWRVELFTPTPENMGVDRNITHTRIYRSITNQSGQGTYFFVAEIPVTQEVYEDTIPDNTVALNQQLVSLYWSAPPADLQAIIPFPNGVSVGFRSNEIWFSESYRPHAWPPGYVLTTEFPIVGIGVCGQAIVVCTQSSPYLVNGINPSAMALAKINLPEPCIHRGSIVSTDTTVLYISPNGLIQISQSGAGSNITESWISRERWQELTPQKYVRAVKLMSSYLAFGSAQGDDVSVARRGFTVELSNQDQTSFTVWPQAGGHRIGFGQLSSPNDFDIDNVQLDPYTGVGMLVQNGAVYYYNFENQNPIIVPYKWRSKVYQNSSAKNFSAIKAWFSVPSSTPAQVDRDTNDPQPVLGPNQYGIVRVYADGELYQTRELRKSGELLRIYSSSKYEAWQIEIEGRVNLSNLQWATSAKELGLI